MAVSLSKSEDEIKQLPLVELAYELLKAKKEPIYFRDIMEEIRQLRGMTEDEAMEVIARLYTEINIDGRFIHLGQNVWGLKRWFPVEKANERPQSSKRFVRSTGDAFSDDDEDFDDDEEDDSTDSADDSADDSDDNDFDSTDSDDDYDEDSDSDDDDADDSDEDFDGDDEELDEEFEDESDDDDVDDENSDDEDKK